MKFGLLVSGNFFRVLGVCQEMGRDFRPDEDGVPGRDAVVILGYDLWKNEFASSSDAIGKTIFLNGIAFTVIGVAPESLTGSNIWLRSSLYVPLAMGPRLAGDSQMLEHRGDRVLIVQGRLRPGVSVAQGASEARVIAQQLAQAYPKTNKTCSLVVDTEVQSRVKQSPTLLLMGFFPLALAAVVLLIACANVMNLMLSRARARAREIAVRLAIGAGRGCLVRQLLIESLVIAAVGGALGLLVAETGVDLFSHLRIPTDIPIVFDIRLDPRALLFTILACVASALLFGLAPALQSTKPDLVPALKTAWANGGKRRRLLGRNTLVIAQVAGALLLLVFATQGYRGAAILLSSSAGFRKGHILMASLNPTLARYTPSRTQEFYKRCWNRRELWAV
jgi:predicted permease